MAPGSAHTVAFGPGGTAGAAPMDKLEAAAAIGAGVQVMSTALSPVLRVQT